MYTVSSKTPYAHWSCKQDNCRFLYLPLPNISKDARNSRNTSDVASVVSFQTQSFSLVCVYLNFFIKLG